LISISRVRVRYAETDTMGVVYHSNFLVYFEIGRTDYFRNLGFTYKEMETADVFMPVTECFCKYILPARYDDELEIRTKFTTISRLRFKFTYEVVRTSDSRILAEGFTVHVPVNSAGNPCRIPEQYRSASLTSSFESGTSQKTGKDAK
jgi:acyl-CoA thioester hydrolase